LDEKLTALLSIRLTSRKVEMISLFVKLICQATYIKKIYIYIVLFLFYFHFYFLTNKTANKMKRILSKQSFKNFTKFKEFSSNKRILNQHALRHQEFFAAADQMFRENKLLELKPLLDEKKIEMETLYGKENLETTLVGLQRCQLFYYLEDFENALNESDNCIKIMSVALSDKKNPASEILTLEKLSNYYLQQIQKYLKKIPLNEDDKLVLQLDAPEVPVFKLCPTHEHILSTIEAVLLNHQDSFEGIVQTSNFYLANGYKSHCSDFLVGKKDLFEKNSFEYAVILSLEADATENEDLALESMKIFKEQKKFFHLGKFLKTF
jgi:hypothetical protein